MPALNYFLNIQWTIITRKIIYIIPFKLLQFAISDLFYFKYYSIRSLHGLIYRLHLKALLELLQHYANLFNKNEGKILLYDTVIYCH